MPSSARQRKRGWGTLVGEESKLWEGEGRKCMVNEDCSVRFFRKIRVISGAKYCF